MCYPADHPGGDFVTQWPLWFVLQLEQYLERSGDHEMVEGLRARVLKVFDYFRPFQNADGLLQDLKGWVFVEWSKSNDYRPAAELSHQHALCGVAGGGGAAVQSAAISSSRRKRCAK